jgi:hypothetical protein
MHNLLKRQYSDSHGSGCAMCKPQKHHHADHRTRQDLLADISMVQQLKELEEEGQGERSRSLVTAELS